MRSLIDGGRRRRPRDRHTSRFSRRGSTAGGRDLIRFRRNRELMAREATVLLLWVAVAAMLLNLARTLWRVSRLHLAERPEVLQLGLPLLALAAAVFCVWRARSNLLEFLDVRREQKELAERLREKAPGAEPNDESSV